MTFSLVPLAFAAIIWSWLIDPLWNSVYHIEHDAYLVRHYERLFAEKPAYEAATGRAEQELGNSAAFFSQVSPELASAQLQSTVQELTAQAGGQVQSSAAGTSYIAHGLRIISVALTLSLPATRLVTLLQTIGNRKPYIIIDGIDIRSEDLGNAESPLDVQLQVHGFCRLP